MPINKESTPPPIIGKAGRYTVFITPPSTPQPSENGLPSSPKKVAVSTPPPPVQPPPHRFEKQPPPASGPSVFGLFWDAVAKVQNAHSSLDEYLADWFGLNQSKYQWALDDYYRGKGVGSEDAKAKEMTGKGQSV